MLIRHFLDTFSFGKEPCNFLVPQVRVLKKPVLINVKGSTFDFQRSIRKTSLSEHLPGSNRANRVILLMLSLVSVKNNMRVVFFQ